MLFPSLSQKSSGYFFDPCFSPSMGSSMVPEFLVLYLCILFLLIRISKLCLKSDPDLCFLIVSRNSGGALRHLPRNPSGYKAISSSLMLVVYMKASVKSTSEKIVNMRPHRLLE